MLKLQAKRTWRKQLCKVDVSATELPAYLKNDDNDQFYIRVPALTQPLKLSEAVEYIEMH